MPDEYDITVRLTVITDKPREQIREHAWLFATSATGWLPQPIIEDVQVSKSNWVAQQKESQFKWAGRDFGPDS